MTPNEVAELLMVSPVTVRQWALKGKIKALLTPGGHRRFLFHDIESFARQRDLTLYSPDTGSLRILIVDDDQQLTEFLQEILLALPQAIEVNVAHNGFQAGQEIQLFKPQIVLLDLMMPGMDGFEVCRRLKKSPQTRAIRVIAMTGCHTEMNIKQICDAGAETCLEKPINTQKLQELIALSTVLTNIAAAN